jgi:hypothetical protein
MITDENGYPVDDLEIEVELRDEMVLYIQKAIIRNLEAIKQFLQIPGYEDICAGLYTYAVEEFGKILYLKSLHPSTTGNNKINLKYKPSFLNHPVKFRLALKELPDTCKILHEGSLTNRSYTSKSYNIDLIANFEARKRVFFAEFTQDKKSIEMPPQVNKALLEKAVDTFLSYMKNEISS